MTFRYAADLAPEEIFNEGSRILARDRARLAGTNFPQYRGQTISPMSSLTQRARALQSGFDAKAAPYSGKINQVLARNNQGINPERIQGALTNLSNQHQNFSQNGLSNVLANQFGQAYDPTRFLNKASKDVRANINEAQGQFGNIQRSSGILEQSSNQALVDRLRSLQSQKQDRRRGLVGSLEQFGAQRHGYNNLVNAANRNSFDQEANAPFKRMDMLQRSLNPLSDNLDPNVLPEVQAHSGRQALQALRAYGVDTNRPVSEWQDARIAQARYPGNLIAPLPAEIQASHNTLEAVSPKFRGSQYEQQKALMRQMLANQSIGDTAMNAVPERMRGQVSNLESAAQKRLKRDLAAINNQFIQANQYGSPLHIKTAEDRAREVSRSTMEQRSRLLEDATRSELSLGHQQQQANLRQTGSYGDQAQREYEEMLNNIRSTNNLGATRFQNEQNENEDLYRNFQNEAGWEWPHLRGAIARESRQEAMGDIFRGLETRNISLDNLAALNTRYGESQREATESRNQLQTRDNTIADLQRQLGTLRQQQQAAETQRQAEAQRQQQQAAEVQRQTETQRQAAEEQRLAALRAETERNNAIPAYYRPELITREMMQAARDNGSVTYAMNDPADNFYRGRNRFFRAASRAPLTDSEIIQRMQGWGYIPQRNNLGNVDWGPLFGGNSQVMRYENNRWI